MAGEKKKKVVRVAKMLVECHQLQPHDELTAVACPLLHELLWPIYEDNKLVRQCGQLNVRLSGSSLYATIRCPTEKTELVVELESLQDLALSIEEALQRNQFSMKKAWTPTKEHLPTIDDLLE